MTADLVAMQAQLNRIEGCVSRLLGVQGEADLSVSAFARKAGLGRNTIHRRIKAGDIVTRGGRIPVSELAKVLS